VSVPAPRFNSPFPLVKVPGAPDFSEYSFNAMIPASQGVSSFNVEMSDNGRAVIETNGGAGFPVTDVIMPRINFRANESCIEHEYNDPSNPKIGRHILRLTAFVSSLSHIGSYVLCCQPANQIQVRNDAGFDEVRLVTHTPVTPPSAPVHRFGTEQSAMTKVGELEGTGYAIYAGEASLKWNLTVRFPTITYDVIGLRGRERVENLGFPWLTLPFCRPFTIS